MSWLEIMLIAALVAILGLPLVVRFVHWNRN